MKKTIGLMLLCISVTGGLNAQRKLINLPRLGEYITLKCDFHMHTVFSDGSVWPLHRVSEAWLNGLDAIAISDHIEYSPKKDFIPIDHNAAWKISAEPAKEGNIILVHAAEITRDMPPGHLNALFIEDGNALVQDSVMDAIGEAVKQGAFIQWNHPGWRAQQSDGIPRLYDIHRSLIAKGWLHGIEFYNDTEYYPLVLDMCKANNLAVICNTDVHGIVSEEYMAPQYRFRPMTLVFAKERTSESLKEALFARRSIAWFRDTIAGKEEYVRPFFNATISIGKVYYETKKNRYIEITNNSDIPWHLKNGPEGAPASLTLYANAITRIVLPVSFRGKLTYDVGNAITGSNEVLKVELKY